MASYDSVPGGTAGNIGALNYAAISQKPIRGATVDILDAATMAVLASSTTDANGAYSASFAASGAPAQGIVRVEASSTYAAGPSWNFSVRDNTQAGALYVLDTAPIALSSNSILLDVRAASGWGGASYTTPRASAPFAILDTVYKAVSCTATVGAAQTWPELQVFWSVNNVPTDGDVSLGQIGTTFYAGPDLTTGIHQIFVLGDADTDTDEFDSHVIAHEWGHYFQNVVSRDDSTGGTHSGGDYLDLRIAFSEGWGDAWSGIVLVDPIYRDSSGSQQQQGFGFDVSRAPTTAPVGWYAEDTNQYLIYTLDQRLGLLPVWQAMTGAVRTNLAASSMFSFGSALKGAAPNSAAAIDSLLLSQNVRAADSFGSTETNNGGNADALPVYKTYGSLGSSQQLCVNDNSGTPNKLANIAYAIVTIPTTANHTITVSGGTDPDFEIFNATYFNFGNGVAPGIETDTFMLDAADYIVAVTEYSFATPRVCLTLTVN